VGEGEVVVEGEVAEGEGGAVVVGDHELAGEEVGDAEVGDEVVREYVAGGGVELLADVGCGEAGDRRFEGG
jgi:hypothetical protein